MLLATYPQAVFVMDCLLGHSQPPGDIPPRPALLPGSVDLECPPNAFVTGDDLLVLEPGEAVTHTWGIHVFNGCRPAPR
jgi:aldose 1-epimerase